MVQFPPTHSYDWHYKPPNLVTICREKCYAGIGATEKAGLIGPPFSLDPQFLGEIVPLTVDECLGS